MADDDDDDDAFIPSANRVEGFLEENEFNTVNLAANSLNLRFLDIYGENKNRLQDQS